MVRARRRLGLVGGVLFTACASPQIAPLPSLVQALEPGDPDVVGVVFLIGDAGASFRGGNPVLRRLRLDVEDWSEALAGDSAVTVLFLGDNVYPNGVNGVGHPDRARDSLRIWNQFQVVGGPQATRYRTPALFIAGNHDRGGDPGPEGGVLLENLEQLMVAGRTEGLNVDLVPPIHDPGPEVVVIGAAKIVAVDSQLWLGLGEDLRRTRALQQVRTAVREPSEQLVIFAAHHPFTTGGPHGGSIPFWPTLGILPLLHSLGALGQDITALPYRRMLDDFRTAFSDTDALVVYAAGHEHNLQVIEGQAPGDPAWTLISGTGSGVRTSAAVQGTQFHAAAPGYMRLFMLRSAEVDLEVVAANAAHTQCPSDAYPDYESCIEVGVAAFQTVYRVKIR